MVADCGCKELSWNRLQACRPHSIQGAAIVVYNVIFKDVNIIPQFPLILPHHLPTNINKERQKIRKYIFTQREKNEKQDNMVLRSSALFSS